MGDFIAWKDIENTEEYKKLTPEQKVKLRQKWEEDYGVKLLPTVEEFKSATGLPTWREIVASEEYQKLTPEQKDALKKKYAKDSGFEPENQVFRSDGNIIQEVIKGITETSATAELFQPEAETLPTSSLGRIGRSIGAVIGDIPMFFAGGFLGGLTGHPEVGTVASFATPTLIKNIYRAKNVGAITKLPTLYTKQHNEIEEDAIPLYFYTPNPALNPNSYPYVIYIKESDENSQKLLDIVKQTGKETLISAATGLALSGASRFLGGARTGNKIIDKVMEKAAHTKSPVEIEKLQGIVQNVGNVNPNAIYMRNMTERIVKSLEAGEYDVALMNSGIMKSLAKKMKIVDEIIVPSAVLTGVPSALEGRAPTGEDVATAVTMTGIMPLAVKTPVKIAKSLLGMKEYGLANRAYTELEAYKKEVGLEIARKQRMQMAEFNKSGEYIIRHVAKAEPKLVEAFVKKYVYDKTKNNQQELKLLKAEYSKEAKNILEEYQKTNENYKYKISDFVDRNTYENLSPEQRLFKVPMNEKMEFLNERIDKVRRAIRVNRRLTKEDFENIGESIKKYIYENEEIPVLKGNKEIKNFLIVNDLIDKPVEEVISTINSMPAKYKPKILKGEISERMQNNIRKILATKRYVKSNVKESGAEAFKEIHSNWKPYISKNSRTGENIVRKKVPVYYATKGTTALQDYQFVYTDAKVLAKYEPNQVVRKAYVDSSNLRHTGLDGVMTFTPTEKAYKRLEKEGKPLYEYAPFAQEEIAKMQEYFEYQKQHGLKTEAQERIILGDKSKGLLSIDISTKYDKEPKILKGFADETLDLTKSDGNPHVVAPITAEFLFNMIDAIKKFRYSSEFILHGKLKQGVYFYEELGEFGRKLRETLIEAETNGMRLSEAIRKKYNPKRIFEGIDKEGREAITYAITGADPRYAQFYKDIGYKNKRDPEYHYLNSGQLDNILNGREKIAAEMIRKFYTEMLEQINLARASVGRDPIKPYGENTYSPLSSKNIGISSMLMNMLIKGEDVIRRSNEELHAHIEEQLTIGAKAGEVTFHNLKKKMFNTPQPEMDASYLMHKYINDAARYISLQPVTVYVADALKVDTINGVKINLKTLNAGAAYVHNRIMSDLGFLQMGHRFAEKMEKNKENEAIRSLLARVQNNIASSLILYNTNVVVNQIAAIRNTAAALGMKGLFETGMNLIKIAKPSTMKKLIQESDMLYARYHDPFREIYEGVSKIKKDVQDAGIFFSKLVDTSIATATYKTAKDMYLRENPGDVKGAIRYANEIVAKTQASTLMTDRAPIQRGILGIYITTFANAPLADYGYFVHNVLGYHRDMNKKDVAIAMANYLIATAIINTVYEEILDMESVYPAPISRYITLKEKGYDDKYIAYSVVTEMLKLYPLGQGSRMGGSALGPIVTHIDSIMKGSADPRYFDKAVFSAIISFFPAYGAAQARRVYKAYSKDADLQNYFITTKEITMGR